MTARVVVGLVIVALAWGAMFLVSRRGFWTRALAAGTLIGSYALLVDHAGIWGLLAAGRWPLSVAAGVAAGIVLYIIFWVGEQVLVLVLPRLAAEVGDLYDVRGETTARNMPLVIAVIGPCEELFWRGFVQHRAGFAVALIGYGAVHLWERKYILVIAAVLSGAFWGGLLAVSGGLVAPVVSHLLWDLGVIVIAPITPTAWATRGLGALVRRRS